MEKNKCDIFESVKFTNEEKEYLENLDKVSDLIMVMVARRVELNMSQRDLALKSGIKQPMIARIEKMSSIPRIDTLIKLFSALGLELSTNIER